MFLPVVQNCSPSFHLTGQSDVDLEKTPVASPDSTPKACPSTPRAAVGQHNARVPSPQALAAALQRPGQIRGDVSPGQTRQAVPILFEDLLMGDVHPGALNCLRERLQGLRASLLGGLDDSAVTLIVALDPWILNAQPKISWVPNVSAHDACLSLTPPMRVALVQWVKTYVGTGEQREDIAPWTHNDTQALATLLVTWASQPIAAQINACKLAESLTLAPYAWTRFTEPAQLLEAAVLCGVDVSKTLNRMYAGTDTATYTQLLAVFTPHTPPSLWPLVQHMLLTRAQNTGVASHNALHGDEARAILHVSHSLDHARARNAIWEVIERCPVGALKSTLAAALAPILAERSALMAAAFAARSERILRVAKSLESNGLIAQTRLAQEREAVLRESQSACLSQRGMQVLMASLAWAPLGGLSATQSAMGQLADEALLTLCANDPIQNARSF
jgi:hypothetical protein